MEGIRKHTKYLMKPILIQVAEAVVTEPSEYAPYVVSLALAYLQTEICRPQVELAWAPCVEESPILHNMRRRIQYGMSSKES